MIITAETQKTDMGVEKMTERVQLWRDRTVAFLYKRDTALMEFSLSCSCIINGIQVFSFNDDGESLAPFLDSAFKFLVLPKEMWVVMLTTIGFVKMYALVHGLIHNNFYKMRARISFVASIIWSMIALAILSSNEAPVVAMRYVLFWFMSVLVFLVLGIKLRQARSESEETARLQMRLTKAPEAGRVV